MKVKKRNGNIVNLDTDKITIYVKKLINIEPKLKFVNTEKIIQNVNNSLSSSPSTTEIPNIISEVSAALTTEHHHYSKLAGRAIVSSLHKETPKTFLESVKIGRAHV